MTVRPPASWPWLVDVVVFVLVAAMAAVNLAMGFWLSGAVPAAAAVLYAGLAARRHGVWR